MMAQLTGEKEPGREELAGARTAPGRCRRVPLSVQLLGIVVLAILVRLAVVDRQGLWADEFFSLAIATGHSLEHHPGRADPTRGDFVELPGAATPATYSRYLKHEEPPAGAQRVCHATLHSDTSPPLYYLLLNGWTRLFGTGDAALRLFSIVCALASIPLVALVAREIGGRSACAPAALLFALSPTSVYYSTEGRMYSLLWLAASAFLLFTLVIRRRGSRPLLLAAWSLAAAVGLLTHYFFLFAWAAALLWLLVRPGSCRRWTWFIATLFTIGLILPWYTRLPEAMGRLARHRRLAAARAGRVQPSAGRWSLCPGASSRYAASGEWVVRGTCLPPRPSSPWRWRWEDGPGAAFCDRLRRFCGAG